MNFLRQEQEKRGINCDYAPHRQKEPGRNLHHWEKYGKDSFRPSARRGKGREFPAQTDELPAPLRNLPTARIPIRTCPCASPNSAPSTATSRAGTARQWSRVRGFTQDDAHIFCTPEQVKENSSTCWTSQGGAREWASRTLPPKSPCAIRKRRKIHRYG